MDSISYKLDQFEGPLDLLLTLISKNKIDINDIPIAMLCAQYMEYITAEENRNIEISSEFLIMASELMLIKSRMLLPKKDDEEDPRASLVEAMLEYQRAKAAAAKMNLLYSTYGLRMVKEQDEISVDKTYVADHSPDLLVKAFRKVLAEVNVSDEKAKERFEPLVNRRQVSVFSVASALMIQLKRNKSFFLDDFFSSEDGRSALVAKFMALLEMLRSGIIAIEIENCENEDGIINADSHISICLSEDADESRLEELFIKEAYDDQNEASSAAMETISTESIGV